MMDSRFYFSSPAQELTDDDIEHVINTISSVDTAAFLISTECIEKNEPRQLKRLVEAVQHQNIAVIVSKDIATMNILLADGIQIGSEISHFKSVRQALGENFIIGAYIGASKHDAMSFGELNADYVAFGPNYDDQAEPKTNQNIIDLVIWWQEMFSIPAIAYLDAEQDIKEINFSNEYPEFVALLPNFWSIKSPEQWLSQLRAKPLN
ncbi:MAG: thiamine phosphate synthase [Alphaproteobacteria bacterium]|nr:thiamine phosphate synthase [Alphaproteobacteria bacterium]